MEHTIPQKIGLAFFILFMLLIATLFVAVAVSMYKEEDAIKMTPEEYRQYRLSH